MSNRTNILYRPKKKLFNNRTNELYLAKQTLLLWWYDDTRNRTKIDSKRILWVFGIIIPLALYKGHREQQEGNQTLYKESDSTCAHVRGESESESSGSRIMRGQLGVLPRLLCAGDSESCWRKTKKGFLESGFLNARTSRSLNHIWQFFGIHRPKLIY